MKLKEIQAWINDPERSYQKGLDIFNEFKTASQAEKRDRYFASVKDPDPGSAVFNILVSQVKSIYGKLKSNPELLEDQSTPVESSNERKHIKPAAPAIEVKKIEVGYKTGKRSLKIDHNPRINYQDLPEEMKKLYDRNCQIPKEQNAIIEEVNSAKTDQERKALMDKVEAMDNEQKTNWKAIDSWYENNISNKNTPANSPGDEEIARTIREAKQIRNLEQDIAREERSTVNSTNANKSGKKMKRIEEKHKKLAELGVKDFRQRRYEYLVKKVQDDQKKLDTNASLGRKADVQKNITTNTKILELFYSDMTRNGQ